jgi:4-amino-4-deoxy-L-arabinose transferase-like glycosyltransferase
MNQPKHKASDLAIGPVLALAFAALVMRVPFMTQYLYHWDSVNFALSLSHYDVRMHQPHPPGYVLYSALGAAVNGLLNNPNLSLVLLSVIGGTLGVVAMYWVGREMFDQRTGLIAAFLALTSPIHWFHSEVALTYALEFALVTLVAGLCFKQLNARVSENDTPKLWWFSALALGIAGGIRQNDLVFLLPLWLVSLMALSWRQRIGSVLVLTLVCLAWLVPMVMSSGGIDGYRAALNDASDVVYSESSIFAAGQFVVNAARLTIYVGYGILLGGLALVLGLIAHVREIPAWLRDKRTWTLALWIVPSLLFYVFIHIRQPGHVFTFLPAVILLVAVSIDALAKRFFGQRANAAYGMAGVVVAANIAFFLFAPVSLFGSGQLPLQTMSRRTLAQRDTALAERLAYVREKFDPASTVVFADGWDFRHGDFYLRNFQSPSLSHELGDATVELPAQVRTLVLFNEQTLPNLSADVDVQQVQLENGLNIRYFTWNGGTASLNRERLVTNAQAAK